MVATSAVYETPTRSGAQRSIPYLNLVFELDTDLDPMSSAVSMASSRSADEAGPSGDGGRGPSTSTCCRIDGVNYTTLTSHSPHPRMNDAASCWPRSQRLCSRARRPSEDQRLAAGTCGGWDRRVKRAVAAEFRCHRESAGTGLRKYSSALGPSARIRRPWGIAQPIATSANLRFQTPDCDPVEPNGADPERPFAHPDLYTATRPGREPQHESSMREGTRRPRPSSPGPARGRPWAGPPTSPQAAARHRRSRVRRDASTRTMSAVVAIEVPRGVRVRHDGTRPGARGPSAAGERTFASTAGGGTLR